MASAESNYLRDLGFLVREEAQKVKDSIASSISEQQAFERGRLLAYYEVLSLMVQQACAFGLPLSELSLEGFNPDSLLAEPDT